MIGLFKCLATLAMCSFLSLSWLPGGDRVSITGGSTPVSSPALITTIPAKDQVKVHFIDVGQADSIYIQLPDNNDILIDAGDVSDGPTVVDYLRQQGMDGELELLIATHPHRDHIGGIPDVLEAFDVIEVLDSGQPTNSKIYEFYRESVIAEGCPLSADNYQLFQFNEVELAILTGNEEWKDLNNYSVVTRLDCGEIEFLFMGDAEKEVEEILTGDISAEILKVGHHGSASSSSAEFLARVNPEVAVISVGEGNRYGHPDEGKLQRLEGLGVSVYRTDVEGCIVETDGRHVTLMATAFLKYRLDYSTETALGK